MRTSAASTTGSSRSPTPSSSRVCTATSSSSTSCPRPSGTTSDREARIVPHLLAGIDGFETLKNVIVVGASNREDLIDPATPRPGRLDVKIKIERPAQAAARQIFSRYLKPDLPYD